VLRVTVAIGVNRNGEDSSVLGGSNNTNCDFASIGDE
jgi:hypothetical protein